MNECYRILLIDYYRLADIRPCGNTGFSNRLIDSEFSGNQSSLANPVKSLKTDE